MANQEFTRPISKIYDRYYYKEPFAPLDEIYENSTSTSFLLLNKQYFSKDGFYKLDKDINPDARKPEYSPQPLGFMKYNYYSGLIPKRIYIAYMLTYVDLQADGPANRIANKRYIAGFDVERILNLSRNAQTDKNLEIKVIQMMERDSFLINNIGTRLNIEQEPIPDAQKNKYLVLFNQQFNEVAQLPLSCTPNSYTLSAQKCAFSKELQKDYGYNLDAYLTDILNHTSVLPENTTTNFQNRLNRNLTQLERDNNSIIF